MVPVHQPDAGSFAEAFHQQQGRDTTVQHNAGTCHAAVILQVMWETLN
jgi:hypothetical protein